MSKLHIGYVLDMSGSMGVAVDDTKGSVASYIDKTKEEIPEARFNLTIFDTVFEKWVDDVPLRALDGKKVVAEYQPRGATALYDAIGKTIKSIKNKLEDGDKAIVVITTDGYENSSRKETKESILNKITKLTKKGNWTFIYLGTNVDAWAEADKIGILAGNTALYSYGKGQFRANDGLVFATASLARSSSGSSATAFADAGVDVKQFYTTESK